MSEEERFSIKEIIKEAMLELHPAGERPRASLWSKYGGIVVMALTVLSICGGAFVYAAGWVQFPTRMIACEAAQKETNNQIIQINQKLISIEDGVLEGNRRLDRIEEKINK